MSDFVIVSRASLHKIEYTIQPIHNTRVSMDSENFNNHHGTSTAFLTNFTKTVKLTKTLIACHYWRWNSFSCDYFNKSWKLLESGFPDRYFGRSMWDRKPYCELSSHSLHHACACTCNGIHEISEHGVSEFGHMESREVKVKKKKSNSVVKVRVHSKTSLASPCHDNSWRTCKKPWAPLLRDHAFPNKTNESSNASLQVDAASFRIKFRPEIGQIAAKEILAKFWTKFLCISWNLSAQLISSKTFGRFFLAVTLKM